ncbi:MAG: BAX inhibitor protein [Legionellaceae bacterium]|nr:BAX inhibitor protein [Legionellaceae bacterium]
MQFNQQPNQRVITPTRTILQTNTMLRKTYLLLAGTLLFSALCAAFAMASNAAPLNPILLLVVFIGGPFLVMGLRNNPIMGLVAIFAYTGIIGYTLGPIVNFYLHEYANGGQLVFTALGGTGAIFVGLSAYALITKKDFSYLAGFVFGGIICAFVLGLAAMIFHMPILSLFVSAAFMLLSCGIILYQTSLIIHGGETSYIMATLNIYIALVNIFLSLLRILGAFSNRN